MAAVYDLSVDEYIRDKPETDKCKMNNIVKLGSILLKLKLEEGFLPQDMTAFMNNVSLSVQGSEIKVIITTALVNNLIKLAVRLLKMATISSNSAPIEYAESEPLRTEEEEAVKTIESLILEKIKDQMKRIKVRLSDIEVKVMSDDHTVKFFNITCSGVLFRNKSIINDYYDVTSARLLNADSEIQLQDFRISSTTDTIIVGLPILTINISNEIIYYHDRREGEIKTVINLDLNKLDVILSFKELAKIMELVMTIVDGLKKVDKYEVPKEVRMLRVEPYRDNTQINFKFSDINAILYNDSLMYQIDNLSFQLDIDQTKFQDDNISINFSPIKFAVTNKTSNEFIQVSNGIISGFKLAIKEDRKMSSSKIFINF